MIRHLVFLCVMCLISACASPAMDTTPIVSTQTATEFPTFTPIPTIAILPTATLTFTPSPTLMPPSPTLTITSSPTATSTVTITALPLTQTPPPTATPLPTATIPPQPSQIDHYWLRRPIERNDQLVDWLDRTYPYGSTQLGARDVHLGVEFFNPRFTPILASADGFIVFAGEDDEHLLGPRFNYYGNVILIQHTDVPSNEPLFTLYGHLQTLRVATGDMVAAGDVIGNVGDSGIAIGPHLHFEVRVGGDGFDYRTTRNPDLWIQPYPQFGTLAGIVLTPDGTPIQDLTVFLRSATLSREAYTYASDDVNASASWQENFTHGDLPVGEYEFFITNRNGRLLHRQNFTIQNGATTFIEVVLANE